MQVQAASQLLIDELAARHTHGFAHEISGMAPNTVAAAPPASLEETGAGLTVATAGAFEPCAWGDFFVAYAPPVSQVLFSLPPPAPSVCVCARARVLYLYIFHWA